jgi:hypothetical protein
LPGNIVPVTAGEAFGVVGVEVTTGVDVVAEVMKVLVLGIKMVAEAADEVSDRDIDQRK